MFLHAQETVVSAWHDVPLYADSAKGLLNFVCEIPKESKAKARLGGAAGLAPRLSLGAQMEVATDEPRTPIKQDTKKGKLRDYPCAPQLAACGPRLSQLQV